MLDIVRYKYTSYHGSENLNQLIFFIFVRCGRSSLDNNGNCSKSVVYLIYTVYLINSSMTKQIYRKKVIFHVVTSKLEKSVYSVKYLILRKDSFLCITRTYIMFSNYNIACGYFFLIIAADKHLQIFKRTISSIFFTYLNNLVFL